MHEPVTVVAQVQDSNPALAATLLQASPDCVKLLDAAGHVLFFNENGLCAMEIDDFAAVAGKYWPDMWPAESRSVLEEALADARASGTGGFLAACPTAKGTPKWWDVVVSPVPGRGAEEEKFIVISRDVTRQREVEAREREYDERLRSIFGVSTDVLWDINLVTGNVWWGEGMHAVFGYGSHEIGDTTAWCHAHIHPEDRARVVESMAEAVQRGDAVWEGEFRYQKADGGYADVHDRGSIIRDLAGQPVRFLGVMKDISERKALAVRQELLAQELAHRVNNTLAVVSAIFQQTRASSRDSTASRKASASGFSRWRTPTVCWCAAAPRGPIWVNWRGPNSRHS